MLLAPLPFLVSLGLGFAPVGSVEGALASFVGGGWLYPVVELWLLGDTVSLSVPGASVLVLNVGPEQSLFRLGLIGAEFGWILGALWSYGFVPDPWETLAFTACFGSKGLVC